MIKNEQYFDKHWSNNYSGTIPYSKLTKAGIFLNPIKNLLSKDISVLDCGCGDGVHAQYINTINSNIDYNGIDISSTSIKNAKSNVPLFKFKTGNI